MPQVETQEQRERKAIGAGNGVMVAFFLPPDVAAGLALDPATLPAGVQPSPAGQLHLTLSYLGDTASLAGRDPVALAALLRAFAATAVPITGMLGGTSTFDTPDENGLLPFYASFDSPELPAFRQRLADLLANTGWGPVAEHAFVPHVTLAYLPAGTPLPAVDLPAEPVSFDALTLAWGGERTALQLGAPAAPEHKSLPMAGNALRIVTETDDELRVENYMILWDSRDLEGISNADPLHRGGTFDRNDDGSLGEFFTKATQLESDFTAVGRLLVDWEHGRDPDQANPDPRAKAPGRFDVLGYVDMATARADEKGLLTQRVLNRHNAYVQWLEELLALGIFTNSTEAIPGRVEKTVNGELTKWPLMRDTITVTPMDAGMVLSEAQLRAVKALKLPAPGESGPATGAPNDSGAQASPEAEPEARAKMITPTRSPTMNLIDEIKKLVPGLSDDQYNAVASAVNLAMADPQQFLGADALPADDTTALMAMDDGSYPEGKALTRLVFAAARTVPDVAKRLPGARGKALPGAAPARPPYAFKPEAPEAQEAKSLDAAYIMRFGDEDAATKAILTGAIGAEYRQQVWEQTNAFAKYLRGGEGNLDAAEYKAAKHLMFPFAYIAEKVKAGYTVAEIKATMVEAQGQLGGFALPPQMQTNIATRLPGLTAIRGGGATVIDLVAGNGVDIPLYTGGDAQYVGALRGEWGGETQAPNAKNATLAMVNVPANVYTYKVPMSQSLVEDAGNLVSLVERDITDTLAIDEDNAFLTGDGAGKPLGILPGGVNALSLAEVVTGDATAVTADGLKSLKRGIASQYRGRGRFIANSDTYGLIERLKDGNGRYLFEDMSDTDRLLNRPISEAEGMPDVAASAYPAIFGDVSGYDIVQKIGMTIQRFQDSNTGPNKVEFHVRRRVGGRVERTWLFAVQKVSA